MKRFLTTLSALLLCVALLAQGKVNTRKYRFSDFTDKVTQVVTSGNEVLGGALRQEVVNHWRSSAFEFCTLEQFEALKTSDQYYFLIVAESRFKDEEMPGITFLTLAKGGPEAKDGIGSMDELISLPLMAAMGGSGREYVYLGALIQAVQDFALAAMESEKAAYQRDGWFNERYAKTAKMKQIYLSQEDLAPSANNAKLEQYLDDDFHLCTEEEADAVYLSRSFNALVGYVVAPVLPDKGSYCYKLLFEADTQRLLGADYCVVRGDTWRSASNVDTATADTLRIRGIGNMVTSIVITGAQVKSFMIFSIDL